MKRTLAPEYRKKILRENIILNIEEEDSALNVKVVVKNLKEKEIGYPDSTKIVLETFIRTNLIRIELGNIGEYNSEEQSHPLPFEVSQRAKIKFRLKIISPEDFRLLGFAENLKEEKFTSSLLNISTCDNTFENIYKIEDFDSEAIMLYLNPKLKDCAQKLKPILAEMAFKDILNYLLLLNFDEEYFRQSKWFKLADNLCSYPYGESDKPNYEDRMWWINQVLSKFAENNKLIDSITKSLK